MSYSDEVMMRETILDHTKNPKNKNKEHQGYLEYTLKNPSCGDMVTIYILIAENKVKDITYQSEGCSISNASTSIMSELLIGKNIDDCQKIIDEFNKMVTGLDYDENLLDEANVLKGVINVPPRIKCATLCYKAIQEIIKQEEL